MTAKTVSPPGLLGELGGDSLFGLLDGQVTALLLAAFATAFVARVIARSD
jgi:hypothetical protein